MICEMGSSWQSCVRGCRSLAGALRAACKPSAGVHSPEEEDEGRRKMGGEDPRGTLMRLRAAASPSWVAAPDRRANACKACLEDAKA